MAELLLKLQEAAFGVGTSAWLWGSGLAAAVLGLFLWLGGTRYSRFVVGFMGAALGAGIGLVLHRWFDVPVAVSIAGGAAVIALIAMMLERAVIALMAMAIFALTFGTGYLGFQVNDIDWEELKRKREAPSDVLIDTFAEDGMNPLGLESPAGSGAADTVGSGQQFLPGFGSGTDSDTGKEIPVGEQIKEALGSAASDNRVMLGLWIVLGAALGLALAYWLRKIIMALCCSIVGSTALISGCVAVLLARQVPAIETLLQHTQVTLSALAAMIAMGLISQLVFTPKPKTAPKKDEGKES